MLVVKWKRTGSDEMFKGIVKVNTGPTPMGTCYNNDTSPFAPEHKWLLGFTEGESYKSAVVIDLAAVDGWLLTEESEEEEVDADA